MKIYNSCEYCQRIFRIEEVQGLEGAVEVLGTCDECAQELGLRENKIINSYHFYN